MACLTSFVSSNALPHFPLIPVCPPLSSPRALRRGTKPSYFFSKCFYLLFQHFFFLLHELFCIFISWHLESCKIYSINGFIVERQKTKLSRNSSSTFSREHRFSCVLNLSDLSKPAEQFFFSACMSTSERMLCASSYRIFVRCHYEMVVMCMYRNILHFMAVFHSFRFI